MSDCGFPTLICLRFLFWIILYQCSSMNMIDLDFFLLKVFLWSLLAMYVLKLTCSSFALKNIVLFSGYSVKLIKHLIFLPVGVIVRRS